MADLEQTLERMNSLEDIPEDLYFIQGNPDSFDEDLLQAEELDGALMVRSSERQVRYSRFPKVPLFGRAAGSSGLRRLRLSVKP